MSDSANIAAIGAGAWGKNIVRNLSELSALAAVAEAVPELREELAEQYPDVPLHDDYRALLADESIDAVTIATPAPTHFRSGFGCARSGQGCVC